MEPRLWKKLIGRAVLRVRDSRLDGGYVRAYALCGAAGNGSVVLVLANLRSTPVPHWQSALRALAVGGGVGGRGVCLRLPGKAGASFSV